MRQAKVGPMRNDSVGSRLIEGRSKSKGGVGGGSLPTLSAEGPGATKQHWSQALFRGQGGLECFTGTS